ncbi:TPA: NYN domain-containing protein [Staphylococcus aureus]|nr:NYN domain-containing protein [Staphylococcus aureus]HCD1498056.1 NYN domain-containing protein [Staphylococcus aureus]HCD1611133.1 NYN domain-containing protein [Staphylococcus aureus]HCD3594879.1 NYN domain-containing protein [Staphylococcus aureus]HCU9473337.1 NYN domain-containing protein [Staphylococcus aureus]
MMKIAVLVDGGYYRKRSQNVFGKVTAKERADELYKYCNRHLKETHFGTEVYADLYRIFYYDCPPIDKQVFHPLKQTNIDFTKSETKQWTEDFFKEISKKRKVALRLGELNEATVHYNLKHTSTKKLMNDSKEINELDEKDFALSLVQKGVDMKIGLDIATLSYKKLVDKIVLIAGDSDFVPAAKLARTEGIDFVLDSLGADIRDSLSLHIDGRRTCDEKYINRNRQSKKDK